MPKDRYDRLAAELLVKFPSWPKSPEEMGEFLRSIVELAQAVIKPPKKKSEGPSVAGPIWEAYVHAYKKRYQGKASPPPNARNYKLCKDLAELVGVETAPYLVRFYVEQNDSFFVQAGHPLALLVRDYTRFLTRLQTGNNLSYKKVQLYEKAANSADASMKYLEQKHGGKA